MICSDDIKTLGANKRREKGITESKENEPKRKKKQTKVIHSTQQLMIVCSVAGVARPAGLQGMTRIHQCQKRMPPYWYRCVNGTLLFLPSFLFLFPYFLFVFRPPPPLSFYSACVCLHVSFHVLLFSYKVRPVCVCVYSRDSRCFCVYTTPAPPTYIIKLEKTREKIYWSHQI